MTANPEIVKDDLHVSSARSSLKDAPLAGEVQHLPTYEHEKALVLKFDLRILPMLALMYLCNALDKGNLGNAKTDGLEKDLHFKSNQYNLILSIFYVPYVVFAPPIGMLGKKYGPHLVLPIMMFSFGSLTLLSASVKNFAGMMTLRWFLGEFVYIDRAVSAAQTLGPPYELNEPSSVEKLECGNARGVSVNYSVFLSVASKTIELFRAI